MAKEIICGQNPPHLGLRFSYDTRTPTLVFPTFNGANMPEIKDGWEIYRPVRAQLPGGKQGRYLPENQVLTPDVTVSLLHGRPNPLQPEKFYMATSSDIQVWKKKDKVIHLHANIGTRFSDDFIPIFKEALAEEYFEVPFEEILQETITTISKYLPHVYMTEHHIKMDDFMKFGQNGLIVNPDMFDGGIPSDGKWYGKKSRKARLVRDENQLIFEIVTGPLALGIDERRAILGIKISPPNLNKLYQEVFNLAEAGILNTDILRNFIDPYVRIDLLSNIQKGHV
jgi:hypothetical protein